jgi:hypothetical protein
MTSTSKSLNVTAVEGAGWLFTIALAKLSGWSII